MKLALFQLDAAGAADGEEGLERIEERVRSARAEGAELALFPELALPGYGAGMAAIRAAAERADETLARLSALSDETGTTIALGMPLLSAGSLANAAVCCRPGEAPVVYAKRFLYGAYERAIFAPGIEPSPVFEIAGLRAAFLVCFDVEFPETVRASALAGADLVVVPTALPEGESARFIARTLVPARAFENGIFVAYADWCGADATYRYQGLSTIAGPDGSLLADAGTDEAAMLVAELDPAACAAARAANDYLGTLRAAMP